MSDEEDFDYEEDSDYSIEPYNSDDEDDDSRPLISQPRPKVDIKDISQKDYSINDDLFSFLFSNKTNDLNFDDIININNKICTGPLENYSNDEILKTSLSCYLIYTNNTTKQKYLLGYIAYKLIFDHDEPDNIDVKLLLLCVPQNFNGMRINSIMQYVLLQELFQIYPTIKYIVTDEIAEQSGKPTNGRLALKLGLKKTDIDVTYKGTKSDVISKLMEYPRIEDQLNELHSKLLKIRGGKRKTNKKRKTKRKRKTNRKK